MQKFPLKLRNTLEKRKQNNSFRSLSSPGEGIDFSSNDYLGLAGSAQVYQDSLEILKETGLMRNGSGGSRLLTGNHILFRITEQFLADFHSVEGALIFNSGYDANLGFFSSIPGRGDVILYDELVHASIRDGISLSHARSVKFRHSDLEHLKQLLEKILDTTPGTVYIVTESVFSMDGDTAPLEGMAKIAEAHQAYLVVDEAHGAGVFGKKGEGLVGELGLEQKVFARINTFGKAVGCHGAVVLGERMLMDYLVNFARSFIYTTALAPHAIASILAVFRSFDEESSAIELLKDNIRLFRKEVVNHALEECFLSSPSAIQSCLVPGNQRVRTLSRQLKEAGYEVKPILSPTVPQGKERLRFCLHSFNSGAQIRAVLGKLATFVSS